MGIEIHLTTRENNKAIEIYRSETENSDTNSFTIDYLFEQAIPQKIGDGNIDISKITVLELSHCNLTDLPPVCKKLNLKYLGLSHNDLKHIPSCLYNGLKTLESLDLSYNNIQNFDLEPQCLPYIRKIKLNNNKFTNIPKWFLMFRCTSLEECNYSNNNATNYKYLKNSFNLNLLKLKKLELASSCVIDDDFNLLKCFKQLQYLDISNDMWCHCNKFEDLDALFVKPKWKELSVLKLNGLSLSILPDGIAWIESLKELHVSGNSLSWLPDNIEHLVNLEVLVVSNNTIVSLPNNLVSLEKLAVLLAANNSIDGIPDLSSMLNLKHLDLYDNNLDKIEFNVDILNYVDFEYNYLDTKDFQCFSLYEEKKNNLRQNFPIENRYDGPKTTLPEDTRDSSSETDEDDDVVDEINNLVCCGVNDENWDLPPKTVKVHSDIDTEDERWQGEDIRTNSRRAYEKERVYVSEDDWMFEDCYDS